MNAELKQLIYDMTERESSPWPLVLQSYVGFHSVNGGPIRWSRDLTDAGRELLELLRREAALERIAATGAKWATSNSPEHWPLEVWFGGTGSSCLLDERFGSIGGPLTADIAEAGQAWAEAQVAPKVATCPCCGKRCE